jgi:hypothetical protein
VCLAICPLLRAFAVLYTHPFESKSLHSDFFLDLSARSRCCCVSLSIRTYLWPNHCLKIMFAFNWP